MTKNDILPREPDSPKRKRTSSHIVVLVCALSGLLISIVALISASQKVAILKESEGQQVKQLQRSQLVLASQMEERLQKAEKEIAMLSKEKHETAALQAQFTAERLVRMAQLQLQAGGDIIAATKLLQLAKAQLSSYDSPEIMPLKNAIAADIVTLHSISSIDRADLLRRIDQLIEQVNAIQVVHVAPKGQVMVPSVNQAAASAASWKNNLEKTLEKLKSLIVIRRIDDNTKVFLAPDQVLLAKQMVVAKLIQVQWAVLNGDAAMFRNALLFARSIIEKLDFPVVGKTEIFAKIDGILQTPVKNTVDLTLTSGVILTPASGEVVN